MRVANPLYICLYFILFTVVTLLIPPLHFLQSTPLSQTATNLDVQHYFGLADPAKFAQGGWLIYSKNWASLANSGLIELWPPGFMLLQAFILKCFGAKAPIVLIVQLLAALRSIATGSHLQFFSNDAKTFFKK